MSSQARAVRSPFRLRARSGGSPGRIGLRAVAAVYLIGAIAFPLAAIIDSGFSEGLASLKSALAQSGALEALRLTLITSAGAAILNGIFGTLLAYVLVRFTFPGRALLSAIVDLPFAIPTLVTGVMLVALYGPNAPVGGWLADHGVQVAFAPLGILFALMLVTLPFVVRSVQPVLLELDPAEEEAARVLGAGGWTTFRKIVLPALRGAIVGGVLLAFARALGEFGAIVIISGNITGRTLTAPVYIFQLVSQFRQPEAAAVATILFTLSFVLVLLTEKILGRERVV